MWQQCWNLFKKWPTKPVLTRTAGVESLEVLSQLLQLPRLPILTFLLLLTSETIVSSQPTTKTSKRSPDELSHWMERRLLTFVKRDSTQSCDRCKLCPRLCHVADHGLCFTRLTRVSCRSPRDSRWNLLKTRQRLHCVSNKRGRDVLVWQILSHDRHNTLRPTFWPQCFTNTSVGQKK